MRNPRSLVLWLLAGVAGLVLLAWAFPRAFPFFPGPGRSRGPRRWTSPWSASATSASRSRDPYVVARLGPGLPDGAPAPAGRADRRAEASRAGARPRRSVAAWEVCVYPPGAPLVRVDLHGRGLARRRGPRRCACASTRGQGRRRSRRQEARTRADAFLTRQGIDLSRYETPEIRSQQLAGRTDLTVRYRDRRNPLPAGSTHGIQVFFAGDRLAGFGRWLDDPREKDAHRAPSQGLSLLGVAPDRLGLPARRPAGLPLPQALPRGGDRSAPRRRRSSCWSWRRGPADDAARRAARAPRTSSFGFATREQNTWLVVLFGMVFFIVPAAVLAFFAWSVGESICRERWGHKLAAFDALFQGRAGERDRGALRLPRLDGGPRDRGRRWRPCCSPSGGWAAGRSPRWLLGADSRWPGLEMVAGGARVALAVLSRGRPLAAAGRRPAPGGLGGLRCSPSLVAAVVLPPLGPVAAARLDASPSPSLFAAALVGLFLATDLLTVLLAGFVAQTLFAAYPLLTAADSEPADPGLARPRPAGGAARSPACAISAAARSSSTATRTSRRTCGGSPSASASGWSWRRRGGIQSSILPDLPPRLAGVDIAHAYLPASEVGGDFYDVLALEDGRLAVAVGDVAGHGVSSGLIMSMAKSALAVQVTFDPEVAAVFNTLNRTVYQTARKRLLTTLCYALLDPRRLEMVYASAGHLHPYRISATGRVDALESIAYPLGVRGELLVDPRTRPARARGHPLPLQRRRGRGAAGGERRDVRLRAPGGEPRPPRRPRRRGAARRRPRRRRPLHRATPRARTTRRSWCCGCRRALPQAARRRAILRLLTDTIRLQTRPTRRTYPSFAYDERNTV